MEGAKIMQDRIRVQKVETLSDDWYILKKTTFDYQRKDGSWQPMSRETYDRGNGAVILLYNKEKRTVVLTRQFRFPAYVNGHPNMMIEACAGLLDEDNPEDCIKREVQEETGYNIHAVRRIYEVYMSPASVTEKLYFFVAQYSDDDKESGGGLYADGEEIEVLELPFEQALAMIGTEIVDAKTIMLLQYAQIQGLVEKNLNTLRSRVAL
jgi:nudix-type nucleoside diphosphatase (YffH/AdpP family)